MDIIAFITNPQNFGVLIMLIISAVFLWYCFAIFYHFIRFGVGVKPKLLALIFLGGSFIFAALLWWAYRQMDWLLVLQKIKDILLFLKP